MYDVHESPIERSNLIFVIALFTPVIVLPPDFDELPTPDDRRVASEEISAFEKQKYIIFELVRRGLSQF